VVRLRSYRNGDLQAIFALDQVCFQQPFRFSRSAMRRFAEASNALTVVGDAGEQQVAGFAIAHVERSGGQRVAYVVTLDVAPEHRRRGLARAMMRVLELQAQAAGCSTMVLHVWVENAGALAFYKREGYEPAERVRGFYGPQRDAWLYAKAIKSAE
jgi:ribosomal-protein-alanine N-acetyltransferase